MNCSAVPEIDGAFRDRKDTWAATAMHVRQEEGLRYEAQVR